MKRDGLPVLELGIYSEDSIYVADREHSAMQFNIGRHEEDGHTVHMLVVTSPVKGGDIEGVKLLHREKDN